MTIGEQIKKIRLEKGLTQSKLGELAGMADSAIRRYENGGANPKPQTIRRIETALGVKPGTLSPIHTIILRNPFAKEMQDSYDEIEGEIIRLGLDDIDDNKESILINYQKLNDLGKEEAAKRIAELTEIPRYQKSSDISMFLANAAHERTDMKSTAEDRAADEDMLDE